MKNNEVFNVTVCIIGIFIFLVHIVTIILKKNKRKDEKALFAFIIFTIIHFSVYLTYSIIHVYYTSDYFVKAFYTTFYVFNNLEAELLLIYTLTFVILPHKTKTNIFYVSLVLLGIITILDVVNVFNGMFFYAENGMYIRSKAMIVSQTFQFIIFSIIILLTFFNKKLLLREKASFGIYCTLPLVGIIIQNIFKGYAIVYLLIIVSVEILFFFLNVQKNMILAIEQEKNKDAQMKLMISQIRPHFIYNSLSSISTLIEIDPERAQKSLDDFTNYLRMNLSNITESNEIPFSRELDYIKTYIELEKIRFNDRLNVIYDIKKSDFYVSPLTIQPLVENAIKHGILKKIEGGTLTIKTYDDDTNNYIEIIDDGIGFNPNEYDSKSNGHYGLSNIKYRIERTKGSIGIKSEINKGTYVKVTLKK